MKFEPDYDILPATLGVQDAVRIGNLLADHSVWDVRDALFMKALDSSDVDLLRQVAQHFGSYGRYKKAVLFYERAYALGSRESAVGLASVLYFMGTTKNRKKNFNRAEEILLEYISEPGAPYYLALLYEDSGRKAEAKELLVAHKRNSADVAILLSERRLLSAEETIDLLQEFRQYGDYEVLGELGYRLYKAGDYAQAKGVWEDWYALDEFTWYFVEYGEVLLALGDNKGAKKVWKKYAKKGNKKARKLLKKHFPLVAAKIQSRSKIESRKK